MHVSAIGPRLKAGIIKSSPGRLLLQRTPMIVLSRDTAVIRPSSHIALETANREVLVVFIQRRKVSLPPALMLLSVIDVGLVFGILGIILATPLAVITLVLVRMLYIQDVLGKDVPIPGND
jgi:hypothetical protein